MEIIIGIILGILAVFSLIILNPEVFVIIIMILGIGGPLFAFLGHALQGKN